MKNLFNFKRTIALSILLVTMSMASWSADYAPFGQFSQTVWQGKFFYALRSSGIAPESNWYEVDFDDSEWGTINGPISIENQSSSLSFYGTAWANNYSSYWVRRHFTIDKLDKEKYGFYLTHDDGCTVYLNGVQIYNSSGAYSYWDYGFWFIDPANLKVGDNVLAVYVTDSGGGMALMDFGLYGYNQKDLSDFVNKNSNVKINLVNDANYPWIGGDAILNTNNGQPYSTSMITLSYEAPTKQELSFVWLSYNSQNHPAMQLIIDGELRATSSTNGDRYGVRMYLDAGSHIIQFKDSIGNSTSTDNWSQIRNLRIERILPLETALLTDKSMPISFDNNDEWPWTIEDGYVQNSNYGHPNSSSRFSTTFTVDKTSKFAFKYHTSRSDNDYNYEDRHQLHFYVDGVQYFRAWSNPNYDKYAVALDPGTHTIEWKDTVFDWSQSYYSWIKDVELSQNWIDVTLSRAGTLGVEALYKADVLTDVELLKVKGTINDEDWNTLRQMTNLLALDLTDAHFDAVPANAFNGLSWLQDVKLPEGITSIGESAFNGTRLRSIHIPASVVTIGNNAFNGKTALRRVTFADNSNLQTIGAGAFAGCTSLQEVIMPNSVTTIGSELFNGCTALKKVKFSDRIKTIEQYACHKCTSLTDLHLPDSVVDISRWAFYACNSLEKLRIPSTTKYIRWVAFYQCGVDSVTLPLTLEYLGESAFEGCNNMKYISLPASVTSLCNYNSYPYYTYDFVRTGYYRNIINCNNIQTIVCPSATPPHIESDPFAGVPAKSNITLKVPSFAVVNYKLDPYWYQFGSIVEGDDIDYWKITSNLSLDNNRRMTGRPDIDIMSDGQLMIGGNAPMEIAQLNIWNGGQLLSECENISANGICTIYPVEANTWYFLAPTYEVDLTQVSVSSNAPFVFRYYDGAARAESGKGQSWKDVEDGMLHAGQGYIFQTTEKANLSLPATSAGHQQFFQTDDVSISLAAHDCEARSNKGWNYVANPYPTHYDVYYMDFTAPVTVREGNNYKAYSVVDDNLVLKPMQTFFVQKPDAVGNIVFHKEGRQFSATIDRASYSRTGSAGDLARITTATGSNRRLFNLQLTDGVNTDQTRVVINPSAQMGYELTCDASKFMTSDPSVPQLFTIDADGTAYAINERPLANGNVTLCYTSSVATTLTISATRSDDDIYLTDHATGQTVRLSTQEYTFTTEAATSPNTSRFTLTIGTVPSVITELMEDTTDGDMYDLQGRKLYNMPKKGLYIKDGIIMNRK